MFATTGIDDRQRCRGMGDGRQLDRPKGRVGLDLRDR